MRGIEGSDYRPTHLVRRLIATALSAWLTGVVISSQAGQTTVDPAAANAIGARSIRSSRDRDSWC